MLTSNMQWCSVCGTPNMNSKTQDIFQRNLPIIIKKLSARITSTSILWICIASMQLMLSLLMLMLFLFSNDFEYITAMLIYGALGGCNLWAAIKGLMYQKEIKKNFVGILSGLKITGADIILYLYNAYVIWNLLTSGSILLIFLSLCSIAALLMDLLSIKLFVHTKKDAFIQLERSQTNNES